jgi:hypothetical protein
MPALVIVGLNLPALVIAGKDNYGKPRQDFADKLFAASDDELFGLCDKYIWLSACANNNPRSDYHWMADATYDECVRRDTVHIYERAWNHAAQM